MPRTAARRLLLCAALPLIGWAGEALAQARGDATVFSPADFAGAAPANALDMVRRLPGFTIIEADADVRGYAGAQGNVLIDGAPPASKRESTVELLRRIPAAAVARIELIRNPQDASGHSLIANVVRQRGGEGAAQAGLEIAANGDIGPRAQLELSRRRGLSEWEVALAGLRELDSDTGRGTEFAYDPNGATLRDNVTDATRTDDELSFNAAYRRPLGAGRLALAGALRGEREIGVERIGARDQTSLEIVNERENYREAEASARYARPLANGAAMELILSQQLGWLAANEEKLDDSSSARFREDTSLGESIARIELTAERSPRLTLNASLEGAFNFLESEAALWENDVLASVPGSDVRIEEERAEAAVGALWRANEALTVQAGLRFEASRLSQSGDSPLERELSYWKPRLATAWRIDERNQARFTLSREVSQLDFGAFVAAASFATSSVTAGNAELRPEETWRAALSWERALGAASALTLTFIHEDIDHALDRVLIVHNGRNFEAPGNIGAATRDTLEAEVNAALDSWGLPGFSVKASVLWRTSRATDPITGETRGLSNEPLREGEIELRQVLDGGALIWGVNLALAEKETRWRYHGTVEEQEDASWTIFAERRFADVWRLRLEASDLDGRTLAETRVRHSGPRSSFPIRETERRAHETPGRLVISLRRNMGG